MTDEYKPLIVEGEEVGDYNDTTYSFGKWQMATVELWESPKEFDAYQYDWETFCEFYKPENDDYKYAEAEDRGLPTDAFNVTYVVEGETRLDVTRSEKMANVFDMYYDRYGKDVVQKIEYGHGTIRPNLWGIKTTPPKKGKKRK